jgi:hypothetical protein
MKMPYDDSEISICNFSAACPSKLLPLHVSSLIVTGTLDEDVPPDIVEDFYWQAKKMSREVSYQDTHTTIKLLKLTDANHYDVITCSTGAWAAIFDAMLSMAPQLSDVPSITLRSPEITLSDEDTDTDPVSTLRSPSIDSTVPAASVSRQLNSPPRKDSTAEPSIGSPTSPDSPKSHVAVSGLTPLKSDRIWVVEAPTIQSSLYSSSSVRRTCSSDDDDVGAASGMGSVSDSSEGVSDHLPTKIGGIQSHSKNLRPKSAKLTSEISYRNSFRDSRAGTAGGMKKVSSWDTLEEPLARAPEAANFYSFPAPRSESAKTQPFAFRFLRTKKQDS